MKRIFNIILLALFCASFAQEQGDKTFEFTYKGQTLKYEVANGNEAMVSEPQSEKISGDVKIPENVTFAGKKYSVTSISREAFRKCTDLTSITIPNSVTTIGGGAFSDCDKLTSVTIPNSVTTIGGFAFAGCASLTSITIPNSVTTIEEFAFEGCKGLTSVTIPNSVETIEVGAFCGENLKSIIVAKDNSHYCSENGVLFDISKKTLFQYPKGIKGKYTIPNSVTTIGDEAFLDCTGLTSITIPNSVTMIGEESFGGCIGLTSVIIPNSVITIGWKAFSKCAGLTSITIPNSVTTIGDFAFARCAGLTSVTIPNSVTAIGWRAFSECTGLSLLTIESATPPDVEDFAFEEVSEHMTICVPAESVEKYKTARGWSEYADKIKAIEK